MMRCVVGGHPVVRVHRVARVRSALPTVVFVHGAANDHGVFGAAVALFRASRSQRARGRSSRPRRAAGARRSRRSAAIADWLIALLDARGDRARRAASATAWARSQSSKRGSAPSASAWSSIALLGPVGCRCRSADDLLDAARRDDHVAPASCINGWSFSADDQLGGNRLARRLDDRQRDAADGAFAARACSTPTSRLSRLRRRPRRRRRQGALPGAARSSASAT